MTRTHTVHRGQNNRIFGIPDFRLQLILMMIKGCLNSRFLSLGGF